MLIIYQIGDFPIFNHFIGMGSGTVGLDDGMQWRISSDTLSGVSGEFFSGSYSTPLAGARKVKITGGFETNEYGSADQKLNQLMSYGGRVNVPVIAMNYLEPEGEYAIPEITWLLSYFSIESIDRAQSYMSGENISLQITPVQISALQQTVWRRLSPWLWEHRVNSPIINPFNKYKQQEGGDTRFYHPTKLSNLSKRGFFYFWGDDLVRYSPTFWQRKYSDGVTGGLGEDFRTLPAQVQVFIDPMNWNAQPLTTYAFRKLKAGGTLVIDIRLPHDHFSLRTAISTLDLTAVDSQLDAIGMSGLLESDTLIAGRCSPFPSFIIRDNEIIPNFIPRWTYTATAPGELTAGPNEITLYCEGVNAEAAYLIDFGVY